jgi:hypothetical protein
MPRPTMRRLAATVLVSAVLTGGLAAGAGTAAAVPVVEPSAGSVAVVESPDLATAMFWATVSVFRATLYPFLVLGEATGSYRPCNHPYGCNM